MKPWVEPQRLVFAGESETRVSESGAKWMSAPFLPFAYSGPLGIEGGICTQELTPLSKSGMRTPAYSHGQFA